MLFLYGPMITIFVLSFQGPEGGLTFPLRGVSLHWFRKLAEGLGTVDIGAAFRRSLMLGAVVMLLHRGAVGAGRPRVPQAAQGRQRPVLHHGGEPDHAVDHRLARHRRCSSACSTTGLKGAARARSAPSGALENYGTALGLLTSALGAHLTWTLPFGLLIMFAVFNRFNPAYEEAARDLGATPWQSFRHVVLPLIGPSVVGIGMFGFTLSWDEIARTSQAIGDVNTLPLELQGLTSTVTTPSIYALGTVTTVVSLRRDGDRARFGGAAARGARHAARADSAPMSGCSSSTRTPRPRSARCSQQHLQQRRRAMPGGAHASPRASARRTSPARPATRWRSTRRSMPGQRRMRTASGPTRS